VCSSGNTPFILVSQQQKASVWTPGLPRDAKKTAVSGDDGEMHFKGKPTRTHAGLGCSRIITADNVRVQ